MVLNERIQLERETKKASKSSKTYGSQFITHVKEVVNKTIKGMSPEIIMIADLNDTKIPIDTIKAIRGSLTVS